MPVKHSLYVRFVENPPPPPKRQARGPIGEPVPVNELPRGAALETNRAPRTVYKHIARFLKTPEGKGARFKVRRVTPSLTRIWRIE